MVFSPTVLGIQTSNYIFFARTDTFYTLTSKGIPGLKNCGVLLKWMVYGDVTI